MLVTQALVANAKRKLCKIADLKGQDYCLVGDGAYAKALLDHLVQNEITLPSSWWVSERQLDYPQVVQCIENEQVTINEKNIVLGTGHFQLEMIQRLKARCTEQSVFWDLMLCAPKNEMNLGASNEQPNHYLLYIDMYAEINIPAYLNNFFEYVKTKGTQVRAHHPLEALTNEYITGATNVIVWNGSTSAFLPLLRQIDELNINITYAECGFFPQHQYFYFDKQGVNNNSQLYTDNLSWVDETMMQTNSIQWHQQHSVLVNNKANIDDYIFVPLQVPSDSNVLNHSRFTNGMQEFIDHIEAKYQQQKVVFKPHPKDRLSLTYKYSHGKVSNDDTQQLIAQACLVHGINSSVLYEAALQGKPIRVEGECLLSKHMHQIDKLLAAICSRQFNIDEIDFNTEKLSQFSYLNFSSCDSHLKADVKFKLKTKNSSPEQEKVV
ncbi:capsule biosynthesis protein [Paraglaciecola sp.]|uniref:capsular polysaccharide export protein, LipB/KpsS family n=1 Tax=Paraglaciecola sp. TaxID=1920173 RepID=UPI0032677017